MKEIQRQWRALLGVMALMSALAQTLDPMNQKLLEQHNAFRLEEGASNIFKMHWNESAAAAAAQWAAGCNFKHDMTGGFGENLFYSSTYANEDLEEVLLSGLEAWHSEKRAWRYSSAACTGACHYTQMVWSSTNSVGCAYHKCKGLKVSTRLVDDALYLACFYYPRGNWIGEYPFKKGRPCSSCGSGTCENGLCVEVTSVSTYHKSEVRSESSFHWSYDSRGQKRHQSSHSTTSHHEAGINLTRSSRDGRARSHHHLRDSATHRRIDHYDSRHNSPNKPHHSSASQLTSNQLEAHRYEFQNRPAQLFQREASYSASGGSSGAQRELDQYRPSSLRLPPSRGDYTAASSRVDPKQADYARGGLQLTTGRRDNGFGRRHRSPLELLRANNHWCRDRLPSCRIWAGQCSKSAAVAMSCPRTCGDCKKVTHLAPDKDTLKDSNDYKSNEIDDNVGIRAGSHLRRSHAKAQQTASAGHRRSRPTAPAQLKAAARRQHQQQKQAHGRKKPQKPQKRRPAGGRRLKNRKTNRKPGLVAERKRARAKAREERRKQQLERKRQRQEKRRRLKAEKRRRIHRKFRTVDRRAENLAENMRRNAAANGGRCEDDPGHAPSCPFWVGRGFCKTNELIKNVFCRRTCGSC